MNSGAVARRFNRLNQGFGGIATQQLMNPGRPISPREIVQEEQDRNRTFLAGELLKIRAEDSTVDLKQAAIAALAAAEVIFPDLPDEDAPSSDSDGGVA